MCELVTMWLVFSFRTMDMTEYLENDDREPVWVYMYGEYFMSVAPFRPPFTQESLYALGMLLRHMNYAEEDEEVASRDMPAFREIKAMLLRMLDIIRANLNEQQQDQE